MLSPSDCIQTEYFHGSSPGLRSVPCSINEEMFLNLPGRRVLLDVVEWRILSYLAVMNVWRGVTAEMVGGALALRENDLNETLQRLKEQKLVEAVSGEGIEQLFVTEEGKRALRK